MRSNVAWALFSTDKAEDFKRKITGGFWKSDPDYPHKPHAGVDYGADTGEVLIAYDDFEVIGVNTGHSDYGSHIFLYFPKIDMTGLYAHLSKIDLILGAKGSKGAVVGLAGNTGKSQGPHLHFGLGKGRVTSTSKGSNEGDIWVNFETYVYTTTLKSNEEIAKEVKLGEWGNDPERSKALTEAGYDAKAIQAIVNASDKPAVKPPVKPTPPKPVSNIGKYANLGGKMWLFAESRSDRTYHPSNGNKTGYNQLQSIRNRSAKILADDNGRVKITVPTFNPKTVWVAKSQISITDKPLHDVA